MMLARFYARGTCCLERTLENTNQALISEQEPLAVFLAPIDLCHATYEGAFDTSFTDAF